MRHNAKLRALLLVLVVALVCFAACAPTEQPQTGPTTVTVSFDLGHDNLCYPPVEIKKGTTVTEPKTPSRDGYDFAGWQVGSTPFSFATAINEDTTLVAKWTQKTEPAPTTADVTLCFTKDEATETVTLNDVALGTTVESVLSQSKFYTDALQERYTVGSVSKAGEAVELTSTISEAVTLNVMLTAPTDVNVKVSIVKDGETEEATFSGKAIGTTLQALLSENEFYKTSTEANYWVSEVKNAAGETASLTDAIAKDASFTVTLKAPIAKVWVYVNGTQVTVENIPGNTIAALKTVFQEDSFTKTTVDEEEKTIGKVKGYYSDAKFTTAYEDTDTIENYGRIYVDISYTTSAYSLGANVSLKLFNEEPVLINVKKDRVSSLSGLFSSTKYNAKLTMSANKILSVETAAGDVTNADADNAFYVVLNGNVQSGLSAKFDGVITVSKTGVTYTNPVIELQKINKTSLVEQLKAGLDAYLSSSSFQSSIKTANTTQARVPLMYVKYLNKNYYTDDMVQTGFRDLVLNRMETITDFDSASDTYTLNDDKWLESSVKTQGWYGYIDYLYTWSLTYNQYNDYLLKTGKTLADNEYAKYLPAVQAYLERWAVLLCKESISTKISSLVQVFSYWKNIGTEGYPANVDEAIAKAKTLIGEIKAVYSTDTTANEAMDWLEQNLYRLRFTDTQNMVSLFQKKAQTISSNIRTRAPFGYSYANVMLSTYANLDLLKQNQPTSEQLPGVQAIVAWMEQQYYELKADGTQKPSTGCNWVGFSGAPLGRSLLRGISDKYSLDYEKSQQAYFPFQDAGMTQQGLSAMVNLDRLYDYFNHKLQTGSNVDANYGLLTMMMHGIDPEHYTKAVETEDFDNEYNMMALWINARKDANGDVQIKGNVNAAVAIAYLAKLNGIEAPSPLGCVKDTSLQVIHVTEA